MIGAFWYLASRSATNRIRRQISRFRQPRYALVMAIGLLYFWSLFWRPGRGGRPMIIPAQSAPMLSLVLALGLALLVASWWLVGTDRHALAFTPAEVQFLFPGPLSRRRLIQYKLLRAQTQVLLSTVVWIVLFGRGGERGLAALPRALGLWTLLSTISLHRIGASLVRSSATEHGRSGLRRSALPLVLAGAVVVALAGSVVAGIPTLRRYAAEGQVMAGVRSALDAPLPHALLYPFRLVVAPAIEGPAILAGGGQDAAARWLWLIVPAVIVMLAHYVWVVRTDAAFEEAAAEASTRRAQALSARRERTPVLRSSGGRTSPALFPLAPIGEPAYAIIWKNLLSVTRGIRRMTLILVVVGAVVLYGVASTISSGAGSGLPIVSMIALWMVAMFVMLGPLWVRNDLRQDMQKLDLLRSYPLSGTKLVGAQIAASTITLSALELPLLLLAFASSFGAAHLPVGVRTRSIWLVLALVVLPAINAVALTIQNAAALLFPGWIRLGATGGGIEAMGQTMLTSIATIFLLLLAWLVPLLLGGGVTIVLASLLGAWAVLGGAAAALGGVSVEVWLLVRWLGSVFDRTDPAPLELAD